MSAINIEVTKNVYNVDLQQEVTTYDVTLEKGYYPLPSNIDLSNYYTKQEVIDNFKPISYNPNIDEVITNGKTTSQSVIFQSSFGGSNWENEVSSLFNVFKKINPTTNEVEVTTYGQEGFNSTSSSGYTAINFAPKTKEATILFPNESGTVVLDYQLNGLGNPFNYVQLNTSATNTYGVGKVYWNADKGTYNFGLLNNVELQLGQEQHVYGKAYSAISNGQLVMYRTSQGGHILFEPANFAQLSANPDLIIGVATQDIALNEFGYITSFGEVNTLNTSSFADGNTLYFGSGNVLQNTVPTGSYFIIGRVNRSHATQGSIFVKPYFVANNSFTELTSNSWDGTNKFKILTANTSITLSTELVNGYILLTQDGTGNRTVTINGISIPINSTAQYSSLVGYTKINGVYYFSINSNLLQQPPIVVSPSFLTFTIKDLQVTGSNGSYSISAGYKFAVSDEFATNEGYVIWENTTTGLVVVGLDVEKTIENFYNASNVGQWNAFAYFYNGIIYANEIGRTYDQQVNLGSSTGITHLRIRRTSANIVLEKSTDGGTTFTVIHTYIGFTTSNLYVKFGTASIAPSTINGLKKLFV